MRQPVQLWHARRRVQRHRRAGDGRSAGSRAGATPGSGFLRSRVEGVIDGLLPVGPADGAARRDPDRISTSPARSAERGDTSGSRGRDNGPGTRRGGRRPTASSWRLPVGVALVLLVILVVGTRSLFGHELPAVGQLPDTSAGWSGLWHSWWSTWQQPASGSPPRAARPSRCSACWGRVLFGASGTLQHVVVLGPLLIGPIGAYRAARWWGSRPGPSAALIAYAVVPLPYNALAGGHWGGLLAYAAAPWVLAMMGRLSAEPPFPDHAGSRGSRAGCIGLGLVVAVVATAVPSFLYVVPLVGAALLPGRPWPAGRPGLRMLGVGGLWRRRLPWSCCCLGPGPSWQPGRTPGPDCRAVGPTQLRARAPLPHRSRSGTVARLGPPRRRRPAAVHRPGLAPGVGRSALGWSRSVVVLDHMGRLAGLGASACRRGGSGPRGGRSGRIRGPRCRSPSSWICPDTGSAGASSRPACAGIALALAAVPLLIAAEAGGGTSRAATPASVLAFLPDSQSGDYRVLWVGAPDALPLAGRQLAPRRGLRHLLRRRTRPRRPVATGPAGATPQLADDLKLGRERADHQARAPPGPDGRPVPGDPEPQRPAGFGRRGHPRPERAPVRARAPDRPAVVQRRRPQLHDLRQRGLGAGPSRHAARRGARAPSGHRHQPAPPAAARPHRTATAVVPGPAGVPPAWRRPARPFMSPPPGNRPGGCGAAGRR